MRRLLILTTTFTASCALAFALWPRTGTFVTHHENVLGTSLDLKLRASSESAAAAAETAILGEIDRLSHILSGYDPTSEFSVWMRTEGQAETVSPELVEVLGLFDTWRERTGGALDASAAAVSGVWQAAERRQQLPTERELAAAVTQVRRVHWSLDRTAGTATHLSDVPLVLNSFAKSYIVERAARIAETMPGIHGVMVNSGGDLVVHGDWQEQVAIADPRASADNAAPLETIAVEDRAVATSGGYRRGVDIAGRHFSHIVDPRTGRTTGHVLGATVVAPRATDAGALATAFCVLSPDESAALASTIPDVEFLLVLADGSFVESGGWRALTASRPALALPAPAATVRAAGQATWDPKFELAVDLELARPDGRARRPYVAVWIEDKDRFPVRTLAVWYQSDHSKWLADLRAWYRGDRLRSLAEGTSILGTVSSATRSPGKYSLVWDGNDNQGRPVKAGTYTINIEAAREHGTYQIMKQTMDFPGVARHVDLPGNVEISGASLDYHPIGNR